MLLQNILFLLHAAIPSLALVLDPRATNGSVVIPDLPLEMCGTKGPTQELRRAHTVLREFSGKSIHHRALAGLITVQVYLHIVATKDQAPYYSTSTRSSIIANQITVLNQAYKPANITFHLNTTTYTIRNDWATDANSTLMKKSLRRGTYSDLNLYFQTNLSSPPYSPSTSTGSSTLLGYCTLPTTITYTSGSKTYEYPSIDYVTDGCSILAGSMAGASFAVQGYNQGKTAVHEVGHWFGLLHTFQGDTCGKGDAGDYCDDTPQESVATSGCPVGKDSCPGSGSPGVDPIHNFMDYSDDGCYTNFSVQQQMRMVNMYNLYRKGY